MPHSLRAKLSGLHYKGILEDKDYKRLCHALDLEKAEQEHKSGKWNEYYTSQKGNNVFNCKECGHTFIVTQGKDNMNYCPNCGCRMVEPQESEEV